jgi:large repetitive protein
VGGVEDAAGNTANDTGDGDEGANGLQNKPVITSAKNSSTKTTITGTLNGGREVTSLIQFFSNPSGNEGKKFIGEKSVTTDSFSNVTFTFSPASKVAAGNTITATATPVRIEAGGTSEFSAPKTLALSTGSALSPDTTKVSGPSGVTKNPTAHFKFTSPDPDATFECSLDGGAYYPCSSPENINKLSEGRHTFEVRAVDEQSGVDESPAVWAWAVERNK